MVAEHYAIHPWFTKQVGEPKDAKSAPVTWNRNWSQDMRELRSFKAVSQKLAANEATLRESEAKVATLQEQLKELRQKHESDTQNLQQRATVLHSDMEALLKTQKERHEEELQRAQREKTTALEELTRQKDEEYDEVMQDLLSEKVRRQRAKNKARAAKEQAGHAGIDRHAGHAGLNLVTWQAGNIAQQKAELMAREKLLAKQASSDRAAQFIAVQEAKLNVKSQALEKVCFQTVSCLFVEGLISRQIQLELCSAVLAEANFQPRISAISQAKSTEAPAEKKGEDDRGSCESDQATEEMNVRTLRKLCKEKGLKVRQSGKADVVPDKSEDSDVTDEVTDQDQDKDDDVETEEQPVLNLSKKRVAALQRSILEGRRQVNTPERYSPSPASFIYDDDDSNSEGISVDTAAMANRRIRLGSDFSGLDTPYWALQRLQVPCRHVFSCDCEPASLKVLHFLQPEIVYTDVRARNVQEAPDVDLFCFGPPCQSYSRQGKRQFDDCELGCLGLHSLAYIIYHKPRLILMEQVPDVVSSEFMKVMCKELQKAEYALHLSILKSYEYGAPQARERVYMVGILRQVGAFSFPSPVPCPPVSDFIDRLPASEFKAVPEEGPQGGTTRIVNVLRELEKCLEKDVNPFQAYVLITSGASQGRCNHMVGRVMTLTRSECMRQGYWCTVKGGFLSPEDMARLQGFWDGFLDWRSLTISDSQFGALLGNAMTLNVLLHLFPHMLRAAGLMTAGEFDEALQRASFFNVGDKVAISEEQLPVHQSGEPVEVGDQLAAPAAEVFSSLLAWIRKGGCLRDGVPNVGHFKKAKMLSWTLAEALRRTYRTWLAASNTVALLRDERKLVKNTATNVTNLTKQLLNEFCTTNFGCPYYAKSGHADIAILDALDAEMMLQAGLLADATDEAQILIRFFDTGDPDSGKISASVATQNVWTSAGYTLATLRFLEAPTHIVVRGEVRCIGGPNAVPAQLRSRCLSRMLAWRALAEQVVRAEHPSFELVQCFSAFDMECFEQQAASMTASNLQCSEALRRVASSLQLDLEELISEYLDLGSIALAFWRNQNRERSNLQCWQHAIDSTSSSAARRRHPVNSLAVALAHYGCMTSSDSVVERDFSRVKHVLGEKRLQCAIEAENDIVVIALSDPDLDNEVIRTAQQVWKEAYGVCSRARTKVRFDKGVVKSRSRQIADGFDAANGDDSGKAVSETMFRKTRRQDVAAKMAAGDVAAASEVVLADPSSAWTAAHDEELRFNCKKQLKRAYECLESGTLNISELPDELRGEARKYLQSRHSNMLERERAERRLAKQTLQRLPDPEELVELYGLAVLVDDSLRTRALDAAMDSMGWHVTMAAHDAKVVVLDVINSALPVHLAIAAALGGIWLVTPDFVCAYKGAAIKLKPAARTKRKVFCTLKFQTEHSQEFAVLQAFQSNQFRLINSLEEFAVAKQQAEDCRSSASVLALLHESEKPVFAGISHCWTPQEFRDFVFQVDLEKTCQGK
ncbi:unnamed protein product [Effrenium voratum]|nr:unnamed protein product [Effrenium voratum]